MVNKLNSEISQILEELNKYQGKGVLNEPNTKGGLVEPMLKTLGWNIHDFQEVEKERKVFDGTAVDYALKISGTPRIFIEAKALDIPLDDPKLIGQTIKYAAMEKDLRWCVLTNGDEYRLYKSNETKLDAENRIAFAVSISECKDDEKRVFFIEMMKRLSRDSVESGEFETWASELFIENRIRRIMQNPSDEFLNIMKEQISTTTTSNEQVKSAMRNVLEARVAIVEEPMEMWKTDGRRWHLEKRCSPQTRKWVECIIDILHGTLDVEGPIWNQKDYIAYRINNQNWLCIITQPATIALNFMVSTGSFSAEEIANRLGVVLFDKEASMSAKLNLGSSVEIRNRGSKFDRITLRIRKDFDLENEQFRKFLQDVYEAYQNE